jgi:hypothetical protein
MAQSCAGCGNTAALRVKTWWEKNDPQTGAGQKFESCERCDGMSLSRGVPVDAAGQEISFPTGGFYSVALGDRWWGSKREFVNYVKENGLVGRPELAMGRKNHDGLRNAPRRRR